MGKDPALHAIVHVLHGDGRVVASFVHTFSGGGLMEVPGDAIAHLTPDVRIVPVIDRFRLPGIAFYSRHDSPTCSFPFVVLDGRAESSGSSVTVRGSYLGSPILWCAGYVSDYLSHDCMAPAWRVGFVRVLHRKATRLDLTQGCEGDLNEMRRWCEREGLPVARGVRRHIRDVMAGRVVLLGRTEPV